MKLFVARLTSLGLIFLLAGCLVSPIERSGGPGSITIPDTNLSAILSAAKAVFARYGYAPGPGNQISSISFDQPAGSFGQLMFGSYGRTTTFRVRLQIVPLPDAGDFRLIPRVSRVSNTNRAGFEDEVQMTRFWSGQFRSILRDIKTAAAHVGPGH
jgi:hypothetical protein